MQPTTLVFSTVLGFFIFFTVTITTFATSVQLNVTPVNGLTQLETKTQPESKSKSPNENVQHCTFRAKQYLPGQVWHANTSSPHCVLCTCTKNGELNCTNLECCSMDGEKSVTMALATMESLMKSDLEGINTCCEKCRRKTTSTIQTISHDRNSHYYDEETDDDPLVKANAEHVSCLHQGKIYRDKDSFASDLSGLPISSRAWDHCMHCICQGGMVLCTLKSCSDFDCGKSASSTVMEDCCAKCSADRQIVNKNKKAEVGFGVVMAENEKNENESASGQNPNGKSILNERLGRVGDMNDIADAQYLYTSIVTTNDEGANLVSSSSSSSLSSSSTTTSQEPTKHFILNHRLLASSTKRVGCVSAGKFHFHGQTWHPIIGPFGSMECVLCKCLHSRIECSRLPCPSAIELQCSNLVKLEGHCCPMCVDPTPYNGGSKQLCVPIYQDVTVYKSDEYYAANETQVTRLSFVRVKGNWNPKLQVEVHEWILVEKGKIFRFYTTYYAFNDFLSIQDKKTFVILGATNTRNLEKFTKREKKLHFRCKAHCNVRIQSLQLTLRLHEVVIKQKCSPTERSVQNPI